MLWTVYNKMMAYLCSSAQVSNSSECLNLMAFTEQKMCLKLNAVFCDWGIYEKKWKTCKVGLSLYRTVTALFGWYRFFSAVTFSTKETKPVPGLTPTVLVWFLSKAGSDACKIIDRLSHQSAKVWNPDLSVFSKFMVSF